jgi:hypothetical protein
MVWSNNLFYIAFLSQIFLMSYYLPNKLLARMQHILETYPPETYPKLYPRPIEHYKMAHLAFKYISRFILLLGVLILFAVMFWVDHSTFADHGFISKAWPAAYGMLQFLPLMAVEFSEFNHLKQMRKANSASKRIADLRRRDLTDLVSPGLLGMALLLFAGAILFDLYVHDFAVTWGHDTIQRALVMTATNAFLAIVGAWNLYGRKLDPHQSAEDRIQRISVSLQSLLYVSMALSVFIAITAADDMYSLDFIDAAIMSLYFQAVALLSLGYTLRSIKLGEIDFDVYKNDAAAA